MSDLAIWREETKLAEVQKLFAPDLTAEEFQTFVWIWKATGLNPFLREIWAVKYGKQSANIFIWRDWYRKWAQANKEYDYHSVDAVYENDTFNVKNGEVDHSYNFKNRWELVGVYCIVKRKWSSKAMFNFVDIIEYYNGNKVIKDWKKTEEVKKTQYWDMKETIWDTKPATMIKKVAEAQWLRGAFQELFAGTYDESENWNTEKESKSTPSITPEEQEKNFSNYQEKFMCISNEDELKKVFVDFNKARKKNPQFMNEKQVEELVNLKDEIKETLAKQKEEQVVDAEVEEITEAK